MGIFADWQPRYAERGIATFPVSSNRVGEKKPLVSGYLRTGLRGSAKLATKFPTAEGIGFACG